MQFITKKQDLYLIAIFVIITISIFAKSYFNADGYISPDSANYLACAQNLLEGHGYYVSAYGDTGNEKEFFAIWPIGYPTLIFLLAKITGLSVFLASKVLNILLIGGILAFFRKLFHKNAYFFGLMFFFGAYIEIFSYTWSETFFIFSLIWFGSSIHAYIINSNNFKTWTFLLLSSLCLFLARYIGVFSVGVLGILSLYLLFIQKDSKKFMMIFFIIVLNSIFVMGYLYHNTLVTGYTTGMPRISSPETNINLLIMLLKAFFVELVITNATMSNGAVVMFIIQLLLIRFWIFNDKRNLNFFMQEKSNDVVRVSFIFGGIGLSYVVSIVAMRWNTQFNEFDYRLLGPGTFLLFIGFMNYVFQAATSVYVKPVKSILILFALVSWTSHVPIKIFKEDKTYPETLKDVVNTYQKLEKNSIVVFGSIHLQYLRTDLEFREPYALPLQDKKETWNAFVGRINPQKNKNIYIQIPESIDTNRYDQSVVNFISKHKTNTLVELL